MDVAVGFAGVVCLLMAAAHHTIGLVWVLPSLTEDKMPTTPFGPPSLSLAMVRVTWYIVTIFVVAIGVALMLLAWVPAANLKDSLLTVFAVTWLAAAVMALWVAWRRVRSVRGLMRLPVPFIWIAIGLICWIAAT